MKNAVLDLRIGSKASALKSQNLLNYTKQKGNNMSAIGPILESLKEQYKNTKDPILSMQLATAIRILSLGSELQKHDYGGVFNERPKPTLPNSTKFNLQ